MNAVGWLCSVCARVNALHLLRPTQPGWLGTAALWQEKGRMSGKLWNSKAAPPSQAEGVCVQENLCMRVTEKSVMKEVRRHGQHRPTRDF